MAAAPQQQQQQPMALRLILPQMTPEKERETMKKETMKKETVKKETMKKETVKKETTTTAPQQPRALRLILPQMTPEKEKEKETTTPQKKTKSPKTPSRYKAIVYKSLRDCVRQFKYTGKIAVKDEEGNPIMLECKDNDRRTSPKPKMRTVQKSMQLAQTVGIFVDQFIIKNARRLCGARVEHPTRGVEVYFKKGTHVVFKPNFRDLYLGTDRQELANMIMNNVTEAVHHACQTALATGRGTVKLGDIQDALVMITNVLHGPDRRSIPERGYTLGRSRFWLSSSTSESDSSSGSSSDDDTESKHRRRKRKRNEREGEEQAKEEEEQEEEGKDKEKEEETSINPPKRRKFIIRIRPRK